MCIKHRKYRQKLPSIGAGLGKAKTAPPAGIKTFCVFFQITRFLRKKIARAKKHRKYRQKMNILKFRIWKGGGGYLPSFLLGGVRSRKLPKNSTFFQKSLFRNVVISSVSARFCFLPWKMQSLNSLVFTVFYACVFKKKVNTSVFEVVQKHFKIHYFGHVVLPKCRK